MNITDKLKANHYRLAQIKENVEKRKAEIKEQEKAARSLDTKVDDSGGGRI